MLAALQHDGRHEARLNTPVLGLRRVEHGVLLQMAHGTEQFDAVVLACHSDQALRLLGSTPRPGAQRAGRHPLPAQPGRAAHRCQRAAAPQAAWAAWNYERAADAGESGRRPCTILLNRLQPCPGSSP
jgi:predicted NAD/FAD-binding protein